MKGDLAGDSQRYSGEDVKGTRRKNEQKVGEKKNTKITWYDCRLYVMLLMVVGPKTIIYIPYIVVSHGIFDRKMTFSYVQGLLNATETMRIW